MKKLILLALLLVNFFAFGQESTYTRNLDWNHEKHAWSSSWITHPTESIVDFGVFLFSNEFELEQIPEEFKVYISADNRYRLFINEKEVSFGPARGSLQYWRYETLNIAPYLKKGLNSISAEVFNLGASRPVAQFSHVTAFIFQSEVLPETLNTGKGNWKIIKNHAYHERKVTSDMVLNKYYVAGPCDSIVAEQYPFDWNKPGFNKSDWLSPKVVQKGSGRGYMHGSPWMLVPRNIPTMEQKTLRFSSIGRTSNNIDFANLISGKRQVIIPPNTKLKVLIDNKTLSIGFPELIVSGGQHSKIKATYSEALFDKHGDKGNRNEIAGKEIHGYSDIFMPDGGDQRLFRPLWIRTFRFVELEIETKDDALSIDDYYFKFTAYPFEERGAFTSDDKQLEDIWNVGWRTARMCALETYMDCPYWEQLQYLGDTRIQSLISLYVAGDDRLMRNALLTADRSRIPEGLTMARGPTFIPQISPGFSLYWVDMVHDYFMHRQDDEFVRQFLPGIEAVLGWFERRMDENGMLGPLGWFGFTDWTPGFLCGTPEGTDDGNSALFSMNFVYALDRSSDMFHFFNQKEKAERYKNLANNIRKAVQRDCFDANKGLLADSPLKEDYSQHTNIFGVLSNTIPKEQMRGVIEKVLSDTSLIQTTIYYKFYLFEALQQADMGDLYLDQLDIWYSMLDEGLSTFEEMDYDDRSDCHAWGSSPLYHFMSIVGGVRPAAPGFKKVEIRPKFGSLKEISLKIPHPDGEIIMGLKKGKKGKITGNIELPAVIDGSFYWNDHEVFLKGGKNEIKL